VGSSTFQGRSSAGAGAEQEAEAISKRTKAALAGTKLDGRHVDAELLRKDHRE